MKSPGIRIDPIYLVDGTRTPMRHEVNQVFFTDVKVPVENRVGEENKGWTYAKYLLEFERGGQAHGPRLRKAFRHLQTLAKSQMDEGEPLSLDPKWREKMAALEMEIDAVEMNEMMFYSSLKTGDAPGNMASIVKMRGTEVGQKVTELAVEAVGWYGVPFTELRNYDSNIVPVGGEYVDDVAPRYFNNRKTTIYGGSSEVQRNVLAKAMLGLNASERAKGLLVATAEILRSLRMTRGDVGVPPSRPQRPESLGDLPRHHDLRQRRRRGRGRPHGRMPPSMPA